MGLCGVLGALAWRGVVTPTNAGLVLAALGFLVAPVWGDAQVFLIVGLLGAVAVMAAGVLLRFTPALALGAVGMFVYTSGTMVAYFGHVIGVPLALLIGGVIVLAVALASVRLQRRSAGAAQPSERVSS